LLLHFFRPGRYLTTISLVQPSRYR